MSVARQRTPEKVRTSREQRGRALFLERGDEIAHVEGSVYAVPSASKQGVYLTDVESGACTCADLPPADEDCKHHTAATLAEEHAAMLADRIPADALSVEEFAAWFRVPVALVVEAAERGEMRSHKTPLRGEVYFYVDEALVDLRARPCAAGCGDVFNRSRLIELHPEMHDGMKFRDGDLICRPCARRNNVDA